MKFASGPENHKTNTTDKLTILIDYRYKFDMKWKKWGWRAQTCACQGVQK